LSLSHDNDSSDLYAMAIHTILCMRYRIVLLVHFFRIFSVFCIYFLFAIVCLSFSVNVNQGELIFNKLENTYFITYISLKQMEIQVN